VSATTGPGGRDDLSRRSGLAGDGAGWCDCPAGFTQTYWVTGRTSITISGMRAGEVTLTLSAGGVLGMPPGNQCLYGHYAGRSPSHHATATNGVSITTTVYVTVGTP